MGVFSDSAQGVSYPLPPSKGEEEHLIVLAPFIKDQTLVDRFCQDYPNLKITWVKTPDTYDSKTPSIDLVPQDVWMTATILFTFKELPSKPEHVPKLRYIQTYYAGLEKISKHPLILSPHVVSANGSGIHAPPIAEWVIMNYLNFCRKHATVYEWQKKHEWHSHGRGNGLSVSGIYDNVGKRVGVLGYGSVGRHVARLSAALGSSVIAYTMSPRHTPESRRDHGYIIPHTGDPHGTLPSAWYSGKDRASLHEFLSQDLDHLIISVPLTPTTEHLLGPEEFKILSRSRTFVTNVSRGRVIDQTALVGALYRGDIRGAALDVADPEPLPANNPLWDAPNVSISPHMSYMSDGDIGRIFDILHINIGRYLRGERLINQVDRARGY